MSTVGPIVGEEVFHIASVGTVSAIVGFLVFHITSVGTVGAIDLRRLVSRRTKRHARKHTRQRHGGLG